MPANEINVPTDSNRGIPFVNPNPHESNDKSDMLEDSDLGKANKAVQAAAKARGGNVGSPESYLS